MSLSETLGRFSVWVKMKSVQDPKQKLDTRCQPSELEIHRKRQDLTVNQGTMGVNDPLGLVVCQHPQWQGQDSRSPE